MPTHDHYVIIGNGPAGNAAAFTLRENDPDAAITIISHENICFYAKPKLVKYLAGKVDEDALAVKTMDEYRRRHIRLRLGQAVVHIDPGSKRLHLSHMETVHYTDLIIASGARARLLPSMKPYADCLTFVTEFNDTRGLRKKITDSSRFFIFGGDLVGFKFLKMLTDMGKQVTLLLYPRAFWPHRLTKQMQDAIVKNLAPTNADVLADDDLDTIVPEDRGGYWVTTKQGVRTQADLVFSFNGLIPDVDFARGCGLEIDHGILVDETMRTSLDRIFACGACAQIYNPDINTYTTSIGWPNAQAQGKVAGLNLLGEHHKVRPAGRKYFDLEGVKIKTAWWEDLEKDEDA
ncbi:MAG: NAD(P)/FAD-dependent oxidoreductase [Desulfotignum sp.]|nr:NAD(P)/FAD-dependent oxidoreductase [Desulfotignum sp.]